MRTTIDVEGVTCHVPARWPKYDGDQKAAVAKMVQRLKDAHGDRLHSVHVDRVVKVKPGAPTTVAPYRIDGGYSTD